MLTTPYEYPFRPHKAVAWSLRHAASDIAGTSNFSELTAVILARRYDQIGRGQDAKTLLTSYLRLNRTSDVILQALEGRYQHLAAKC